MNKDPWWPEHDGEKSRLALLTFDSENIMSNEAQAVRAQIESALAAGPTPGAWTGQEFDEALTGDSIPSFVALPMGRNHHDSAVDAAYIAACNPANIRILLDDHDAQLRAANERIDALTEELRVIHEDAEIYGVALNDAGWEFNDAMPRYTGANTTVAQFNLGKSICRDVILRYLEKCQKLATNQDKPA